MPSAAADQVVKCLFPAAGYGTRFLPATKSLPKEMLPIVNVPLLHFGVREAAEAGMDHICFVTGRSKEAITNYFDVNYELESQTRNNHKANELLAPVRALLDSCTFSYTRQKQMRGLGDAILCGQALIGQQPFGVILADDLCFDNASGEQSLMRQLVEAHRQSGCAVVAAMRVGMEQRHRYGVIEGDEIAPGRYQARRLVEKPAISSEVQGDLAVVGRYLLIPEVFEILAATSADAKGEVQITDALNQLAQQGKVIALEYNGLRFDCGNIDGFCAATNFVYNHDLYL